MIICVTLLGLSLVFAADLIMRDNSPAARAGYLVALKKYKWIQKIGRECEEELWANNGIPQSAWCSDAFKLYDSGEGSAIIAA